MKKTLILLVAPIICGGCKTDNIDETKPNILLVMVDDMADWVISSNKHPDILTPNIDRLIQRGIAFENAYCASPISGPSRAAIMTGRLPENSGVYHNVGTYIDYLPDAIAYPEYLREGGYHVMGTGKINHASTKVVDKNWDEYGPGTGIVGSPFTNEELLTENMDPTVIVKRDNWSVELPMNKMSTIDRPSMKWSTFDWGPLAIDDSEMPDGRIASWACNKLSETYEKPFFLGVGFYKPHLPFFAPQKYFDLYKDKKITLPTVLEDDLVDLSQVAKDYALLAWTAGCHKTVLEYDEWEDGVLAYLATISFVDAQIGRVLDALDNSEYNDNTWIILASDHGFHLGEKEHWGKNTPWQNATKVPFLVVPPKDMGIESRIESKPVSLIDIYPTLAQIADLPIEKHLDGKSLIPLLKEQAQDWREVAITTIGRGTHSITDGTWKYIHYYDGSEELYNLKNDPYEFANLINESSVLDVLGNFRSKIPDDPNFSQFIRFDQWKVAVKKSGEIMLFDIYSTHGISEEKDVAAENPEIVDKIKTYMTNHKLKSKFINLTGEI